MAEEYHEENPNRVTATLEKATSSNNGSSIPIFQALKDREYDGKFKKGTRIHTVDRTDRTGSIRILGWILTNLTTWVQTHYF